MCNKAFKNKIFKQTFQEIYKKAFDNAMDIIMNSNSCSEIFLESESVIPVMPTYWRWRQQLAVNNHPSSDANGLGLPLEMFIFHWMPVRFKL